MQYSELPDAELPGAELSGAESPDTESPDTEFAKSTPEATVQVAARGRSADAILPIVIISLEEDASGEIAPSSDVLVTSPEPHLQLIEQFLQAKAAGSTQKAYRHQLMKFVTHLAAIDNPLNPKEKRSQAWETVTADEIRKYVIVLRQAGQKPTSIKQALSAIQSFYKWLRQQGHYPATQALPTDLIDRRFLDRR
ncbi:site-specific integrase [Alkalinema pantanalense CENA528]|uniref:site-specific integrase n=1 Tax=Alkalinema pantanalense TaxID=1620705 RepID=UPI003D6E8D3A